jgi:hypothetical protein
MGVRVTGCKMSLSSKKIPSSTPERIVSSSHPTTQIKHIKGSLPTSANSKSPENLIETSPKTYPKGEKALSKKGVFEELGRRPNETTELMMDRSCERNSKQTKEQKRNDLQSMGVDNQCKLECFLGSC